MNKILSNGMWSEIGRLSKKARERRAAIAYVTKDSLGLKRGDTLVVDASDAAIKGGQTSARALWSLSRRGVQLFSFPGLHAKVISLGDTAIIGSANMSANSATDLLEAAIATDAPSIVAGVTSLIYRVCERSLALSTTEIRRLMQIKVTPRLHVPRRQSGRGIAETGATTWLLATSELKAGSFREDQAAAERELPLVKPLMTFQSSEANWIRWPGRDSVREKLRPGDSIIELWSPLGQRDPTRVYRYTTVLSRKERSACSLFFIESRQQSERDSMSSSRFRKLLKHIGFSRTVGRNTACRLKEDLAVLIDTNWKRFANA
jgi:hypothetical protein